MRGVLKSATLRPMQDHRPVASSCHDDAAARGEHSCSAVGGNRPSRALAGMVFGTSSGPSRSAPRSGARVPPRHRGDAQRAGAARRAGSLPATGRRAARSAFRANEVVASKDTARRDSNFGKSWQPAAEPTDRTPIRTFDVAGQTCHVFDGPRRGPSSRDPPDERKRRYAGRALQAANARRRRACFSAGPRGVVDAWRAPRFRNARKAMFLNPALGAALDRISERAEDVRRAFTPGSVARYDDVAVARPSSEFTLDPLVVSAADGLYFVTRNERGEVSYTRDGSFTLRNGFLVDGEGKPIRGSSVTEASFTRASRSTHAADCAKRSASSPGASHWHAFRPAPVSRRRMAVVAFLRPGW